MLKVRIIPILLLKGSSLVKSVGFRDHRVVGDAMSSIKVFSRRFADEMIILDLDAAERGSINSDLLSRASGFCNMPLSFGGGVDSLEKADLLFQSGADKIVVNSVYFKDPNVVGEIIEKYGSQSVILSLDVRLSNSTYFVHYDNGEKKLDSVDLFEVMIAAQRLGVGEFLVNDILRDGAMEGLDLKLVEGARKVSDIPLLVAGGCESKVDFKRAFDLNVDGVCAGSIFHWIGESIIGIKKFLNDNSIKVRNI